MNTNLLLYHSLFNMNRSNVYIIIFHKSTSVKSSTIVIYSHSISNVNLILIICYFKKNMQDIQGAPKVYGENMEVDSLRKNKQKSSYKNIYLKILHFLSVSVFCKEI